MNTAAHANTNKEVPALLKSCDVSSNTPPPATQQQVADLLDFMANGYITTRLTTANQLGIANLTAVISDARDLIGPASIRTEIKRDSHGHRYASYSIPDERLAVLIDRGYFRRDSFGSLRCCRG